MEQKQRKSHTISDLDSQIDENAESRASDTDEGEHSHVSERAERAEQDDSGQALAAKTEECAVLQEKYLRLAAEFENYKRIAQRDQREHSRFANEQLLRELLPVLDNLERAIQSAKSSADSTMVIEGVQLTLKQCVEILSKFGIRQISSVGQPFDPSRHQAVTRVEKADVPENTVVEEFQKGYLLHERVLRPAMVSVATASRDAAGASRDTDQHSSEQDSL